LNQIAPYFERFGSVFENFLVVIILLICYFINMEQVKISDEERREYLAKERARTDAGTKKMSQLLLQ